VFCIVHPPYAKSICFGQREYRPEPLLLPLLGGRCIGKLHDPHQHADTLQIGTHGNVLVRAVDPASRKGLVNNERAAAQAGVADPLILVRVGCAGRERRHSLDCGVELAEGRCEHTVLKNTNVVPQTPEISGAEWEYLTVDNVNAFKIKNLPRFASDTDLTPLIYAVEEDQVAGYLTPGYTDADGELPAVPVNNTCAKNGMRIVNAQEGGVELPNTGGPGILGFTVLGASLCLSAGALTVKIRRKDDTKS